MIVINRKLSGGRMVSSRKVFFNPLATIYSRSQRPRTETCCCISNFFPTAHGHFWVDREKVPESQVHLYGFSCSQHF